MRKQASGQSAQTQLRVGRLTKAHGLKGGLKVELYTDDPDRRFQPGAEFSLQVPTSSPWHGKRLALAELRWYNGQPVGFFEGVTDRSGAESLVKAILWVDSSADEPAEEDAWYDHQLVGLGVVRDDAPIGTIVRVEHLPAQDLLVVKTADREVMVPFVKAIVPSVDTDRRIVIVTPPPGLFEDLPDDDDEPQEPAAQSQVAGESGTAVDSGVQAVAAASESPEDRTDAAGDAGESRDAGTGDAGSGDAPDAAGSELPAGDPAAAAAGD